MLDTKISSGALILVGDGRKVLFLRNEGSARHLKLVIERVLEQENPPTHEQGSDRPGRAFASVGERRSSLQETDWHQLAEDRFAGEIAAALYRLAHANSYRELIIIAPPKVLGELRKAFHKEVVERITAEVPKELTSHPVADIARLLVA